MLGSTDFVEAVQAMADVGDGYLVVSDRGLGRHDMATIAFYNVPRDIGREGGGAVAMNNRLLMFVDGFGRGPNEPAPTGKVKFKVGAAELLPREKMPRGKTATPEKMAEYVARIISEASQLPPCLPGRCEVADYGRGRLPNPDVSQLGRKLHV